MTLLSGYDEPLPLFDRHRDTLGASDISNTTSGEMTSGRNASYTNHLDDTLGKMIDRNNRDIGSTAHHEESKMLHQNSQNVDSTYIVADKQSNVNSHHPNINTSNGFKYFNKGECPVCHERGDCRQSLSSGLVHCRAGVPGAIGTDSLGFGLYAADGLSRSMTTTTTNATTKDNKKVEAKKSSPLNTSERDAEIRKLSQSLGLADDHREALRRRGLTDSQIEAGCYFSVIPWQQVDIDPRFPGLDGDGKRMMVGGRGIAIPVPTSIGQFIGLQVRLDNPDDGGKYRWVSSSKRGYSAHYDDEMPIGVYRPEVVTKGVVGLVEGMLKPAVACQRWGHVMIGAAGGNFSGSRKQLKDALDELYRGKEDKTVLLYPDGSSKFNEQVMNSYRKTCELVESWGYTVLVVWWGQDEKGSDADEIDVATIKRASYQNTGEFFSNESGKGFDWKKANKQCYENLTKLTPSKQISVRYLSRELLGIRRGINGVKSPTNTGKTEVQAEQVRLWKERYGDKAEIISLYSRNALATQAANRLGVDFWHDVKAGWLSLSRGVALCIDSIVTLANKAKAGSHLLLLIDEVESVLDHMLDGSTCEKQRSKILSEFGRLVEAADTVLVMDAHLSDWSISYLLSLRKETEANVIANSYRIPRKSKVHLIPQMATIDKLLGYRDREGLKAAYYASDSLKHSEAIKGSHYRCWLYFLDQSIDTSQFKTLVINSHKVNNAEQKEFMAKPDEMLAKHPYKLISVSPSVECGLNITTEGYFSAVYGTFVGTVSPHVVLQMLSRVREDLDWFVYVPTFAKRDERNWYQVPGLVERREQDLAAESLRLIVRETVEQLLADMYNEYPQLVLSHYGNLPEDLTAKAFNEEAQIDKRHQAAWYQLKARKNYAAANFKEVFIGLLEDEGREIFKEEKVTKEVDRKNMEFWCENNSEEMNRRAAEITRAKNVTLDQAISISNSGTGNEEALLSATKAFFAHKFPLLEVPTFFDGYFTKDLDVASKFRWHVYGLQVRDGGERVRAYERAWLLEHEKEAEIKHHKDWMKHFLAGEFAHQDVPIEYLRIKALKQLMPELKEQFGIGVEGVEMTEEGLSDCFKWLRTKRRSLLLNLGISIGEKTQRVKTIGRIYALLGYDLVYDKDDDGKRHYSIFDIGGDKFIGCYRKIVYENLDYKYSLRQQEEKARERDTQTVEWKTACPYMNPDGLSNKRKENDSWGAKVSVSDNSHYRWGDLGQIVGYVSGHKDRVRVCWMSDNAERVYTNDQLYYPTIEDQIYMDRSENAAAKLVEMRST